MMAGFSEKAFEHTGALVKRTTASSEAAFGPLVINDSAFLLWDDPYGVLEESEDLQTWKRLLEPPNPFPVEKGRPRLFYRVHR